MESNTTAASGRRREYEILRGISDSSEGEEARRFRTEGKIRPLPEAEEGSMRFCEEQAIQANAQKRADSEQREK